MKRPESFLIKTLSLTEKGLSFIYEQVKYLLQRRKSWQVITETAECGRLVQRCRDNWAKLRYRLTLTPILLLFDVHWWYPHPLTSIRIKFEWYALEEARITLWARSTGDDRWHARRYDILTHVIKSFRVIKVR